MIKDKGQFLAKAKTLIAQNIQSRTLFTRGDLDRFIGIDPNVEESLDYLVTLQALTETRYIEWFEEPDRGRFIPKAPANLNSVWDLTSNPPTGFVSDKQVYPIAGSLQVLSCPICSGAGELTKVCSSCNGSGRRVCIRCGGQGAVFCSSCGGSGRKGGMEICNWCAGQGNRVCSSCSGTGVTSFGRCFRCNGSGRETCSSCGGKGGDVCLSCNGNGRKVCSSCGGKGEEVCFLCTGTGKVIVTCSKCAGVGRLRRYQGVVCVFKPHEFNEVVSRWVLPIKPMKAASASDVWQTSLDINSPPDTSRYPSEVQRAINSLANQMMGLKDGKTQLVRNQLTVKAVPVARIFFRLHGVIGDACLLGKDFEQVYLPKVPFTFKTWLRL
ncbi:MAG: hypothetical protein ACK40X_12705, partial [Armatimonadota bacterium]